VLIKSDADNRLCEELQSMAASSIVLRTLILSHQFLVGCLAGVGLQLVISLDVGWHSDIISSAVDKAAMLEEYHVASL